MVGFPKSGHIFTIYGYAISFYGIHNKNEKALCHTN